MALLEGQPEPETLSQAVLALEQSLLSLESVEEVRFLVDGELAATKMIAVSAGSFRVVTIPLTLDAGEHVITVGGMTANLTVE